MSREVERFRGDSYCGLYCGACSIFMRTQADEADQATDQNAPDCHGCKSGQTAPHCNSCEIRSCAGHRGLEFCSECPEYPCKRLLSFKLDGWPHHLVAVYNLKSIEHDGSKKWLADQEELWSCPSCQRPFEFYQSQCPTCQAQLRDSRVQAAELIARDGLTVDLRDV